MMVYYLVFVQGWITEWLVRDQVVKPWGRCESIIEFRNIRSTVKCQATSHHLDTAEV